MVRNARAYLGSLCVRRLAYLSRIQGRKFERGDEGWCTGEVKLSLEYLAAGGDIERIEIRSAKAETSGRQVAGQREDRSYAAIAVQYLNPDAGGYVSSPIRIHSDCRSSAVVCPGGDIEIIEGFF
jgi:hypothetical protein